MPKTDHRKQSDSVVIKVPRRVWYALKRVQAYAPPHLERRARSFGSLLESIGDGNRELYKMWRERQDDAGD